MDQAKNCKTCKHSEFDSFWNDWRCKKLKRVIFHPERRDNCEMYKEKTEKK